MVAVWGESRYVVLARELTKTRETIHGAPVGELLAWVKEDENRRKGEMVLIVEGHKAQEDDLPADALRTLALLQAELPLKKAAALAAEIHGVKKNALYKYALEQQGVTVSTYQPPFVITPLILNQVIEIGELMGNWAAMAGRASPLLRKENRIRTIQASLAIEHNSLTTEQVTALMEGKRILAPAKDIQEVRNAILAYEKMSEWKSERLSDLLQAHQILMMGLVDNPGQLRTGNVGVYREKQLIHMAPPASQVLRLMNDLLGWLKTTELHPLIAGAIFHYEFEFIHPFADGNGRMGRLWQTLILREWRSELAWLPVETLIHYQQDRYYRC